MASAEELRSLGSPSRVGVAQVNAASPSKLVDRKGAV